MATASASASQPRTQSLQTAAEVRPLTRKRRLRLTPSLITGGLGVLIIVTITLVAVFAPQIAPYDPAERVARPFVQPNADHRLGTNDIGQDILSELIYGARISLMVGVAAGLFSAIIGTVMGGLSGFYPKTLGRALMSITDVVLVMPFLPLLIILAAYMGRSLTNTIIIISVLIWAGTARIIRSEVLVVAQSDFVLAARSQGASDLHILWHHIRPQIMVLAMGEFVQATAQAILLEAALSFLGLGDPLQKSWGTVLYWAQVRGGFLSPAWEWWVLPPGLLISAVTLGFALVGFALEQHFNPRLKRR